MFRALATWYESLSPGQPGYERVFALHPLQLTRFLEEAWRMRSDPGGKPSPAIPPALFPIEATSGIGPELATVAGSIYAGALIPFRHAMYAYLVENTRAVEILRRVLEECRTGENLDVPSPEGQQWLRTTEALFFSDPHPGGIMGVTSHICPDFRAVRCNLYYRLFGMDLNHGRDDGTPYPYVKPAAANREFVPLWEEFLREVWRGIENFKNTSGANATDDAAIAELGATLADLLTVRQRNGVLAQVEFISEVMASWFHLTLMSDTPIVVDLKCAATSPEERLRKLGERVRYASDPNTEQYFAMADAASYVLLAIEARQFANASGAASLYAETSPPDPPNRLRDMMMTIIAQWSIATGRDMKAHKVQVAPRAAPVAVGAPAAQAALASARRPQLTAMAGSHNGHDRPG